MPFRVGAASILIFLAAVSVVGVTACSGSASPVAHPAASPSVKLSQSTQASQSDQLTGTQLADALLPAAAFPHGFRGFQPTAFNTGNQLETGPAKHHLDSMSCADIGKFYSEPGFGESALAGNNYSAHPGYYAVRHKVTFAQMVYQFASRRAAKSFWRGLRAVAARCPAWAIVPPSQTTAPVFTVRLTGAAAFQMNSTIVGEKFSPIRTESLVAVIGQDVFEIDASAIERSIPPRPSVRTLMLELTARVQGR
ncbi:MAG TPA: hypothetical protein VFQ68_19870 [Streptosporangiaceae bacterium]|nr:hypothetical protein [Streptosporangiaceae bacterium]